jgi:uncharacterized protein
VKRYIREPGHEAVRPLFRRRAAAAAISGIEVPAALWRRAREGDLAEARARALVEQAKADLAEMILVEVRRGVIERAQRLVEQHPLRAYDAVQLASARRLCEVAEAEQLRTLEVGGGNAPLAARR